MTVRRRPLAMACVAILGLAGLLSHGIAPAVADDAAAGSASPPATVSSAASAATALPSMATDAAVLRGSFVQQKYLAELSQPLISRGHYVVARGQGLLWIVTQPVASTLVITPDALSEDSGGTQTLHVSVDQQPALGAVASILLAVFRGNTAQLDRYFAVTDRRGQVDGQSSGQSSGQTNAWTATLRPRSDAVGQFITRLEIQGDRDLRHIRIQQPGGDHSDIELDPAAASNDALTADEKAAFAR